ncbi:MAG: alanine--tRNA ligase [Acidobacteriaceae bacterium]|nr:alanine--tRNA ligase [Acidobacteriaceae bacterium]
MTSEEVVQTFLRFFEKHGHLRIPGASIVPKDDPTLLFINSGMAPLKPYFLGQRRPPQPNLCNVQPCIRTVDIDSVGDRHHLTLFEMLGSWSIGQYWKDHAIELAYALLVDEFHYDPKLLYASVYSGNPDHNIPPDDESIAAWERVGLASDHIVLLGEDNFWGPAGKYGPCGPCTEVFFDTGAEHGPTYVPGGHFDSESRYIEIWNAGVFMEFDKQPNGLSRLGLRSVDTGSGLERMLMNLNRCESVYETDRLRPIFEVVREQMGGASDESVAGEAKMITDHLRSASFILAHGVTPSNTGRGYIPRRLIRKCVAMTTRRRLENFRFDEVLNTVIEVLGRDYSVLPANRNRILELMESESKAFALRMKQGLERLSALAAHKPFRLSGQDALSLFATFGVPLPIIRDLVGDYGGELDEAGFEEAFKQHQEVSRTGLQGEDGFEALAEAASPTVYLGEENTTVTGLIQALFVNQELSDRASEGAEVDIVVDRTTFYAEGGGQVGDTGIIKAPHGAVEVADTVKRLGLYFVHHGKVVSGSIARGETVELQADGERRLRIRANHSATHLLQSALRTVLGPHVQQAGSRVEASRLRFDFQHTERVTPEQRRQIELLVNSFIRKNVPAQIELTTYADAISRNALAFFGDTYGETVRMIRFDGFSTELCGGSHVRATGDIGAFRILSESSVMSGVRRIVALTGEEAIRHSQHADEILEAVSSRLHVAPDSVEGQIVKILERAKQQTPTAASGKQTTDAMRAQLQTAPSGVPYLFLEVDQDPVGLRTIALEAAEQLAAAVSLISIRGDKMSVVVCVSKSLTNSVQANDILARMLSAIKGGHGGGKAHLAQGGGPAGADINALRAAFAQALEAVPSNPRA